MVDLDGLLEDRLVAVEDREIALPILYVSVGVELGNELVQADREAGLGDGEGLVLGEREAPAHAGQSADDASGQDDQEADMDDGGAENAQDPFSGEKTTSFLGGVLSDAVMVAPEYGLDGLPGRSRRQRHLDPVFDLEDLDTFGVEVALGPENTAELGGEADERTDDDIQAEKGEDGDVPEGLVKPGELELLEEAAELAVTDKVFLAGPALGDQGSEDGGGDQED